MEIRCSKLSRVMSCAGVLSFTDLIEEENDAAKEGTAAGEALRAILEYNQVPLHASNGVQITDEMKFFVQPIADEMMFKDGLKRQILCEQRIDWKTRSGIWIRGQYDVSFADGDTLYIDDLKYGWGLVEVKDNWQLLGYAIGEVIRRGTAFAKIVLRIHQPRPHHEDGSTRPWVLTYSELLDYKEKIEKRMDAISEGENRLVTGPQCKYCPAAIKCPALNKAFYRGIELVHEFLEDSIDNTELAFQLDLIGRIEEVLKIKATSIRTLGIDRIKRGEVIPGYLADSSFSDRKWKNGITADVIKALTGKDIVEHNLMSPAKAEKAGIPKDFVNSLVDRHFLGQKLVKKDHSAMGNLIFGKNKPS